MSFAFLLLASRMQGTLVFDFTILVQYNVYGTDDEDEDGDEYDAALSKPLL